MVVGLAFAFGCSRWPWPGWGGLDWAPGRAEGQGEGCTRRALVAWLLAGSTKGTRHTTHTVYTNHTRPFPVYFNAPAPPPPAPRAAAAVSAGKHRRHPPGCPGFPGTVCGLHGDATCYTLGVHQWRPLQTTAAWGMGIMGMPGRGRARPRHGCCDFQLAPLARLVSVLRAP